MNRTTFRNTVLGIGATAAAIAFGYFGVQQLGRNNMFTELSQNQVQREVFELVEFCEN
jgi:hypothetical protein